MKFIAVSSSGSKSQVSDSRDEAERWAAAKMKDRWEPNGTRIEIIQGILVGGNRPSRVSRTEVVGEWVK